MFSFLAAVARLISVVGDWLRERQLINAGRDAARADFSAEVLKDVADAKDAVDGLDDAKRAELRAKYTKP